MAAASRELARHPRGDREDDEPVADRAQDVKRTGGRVVPSRGRRTWCLRRGTGAARRRATNQQPAGRGGVRLTACLGDGGRDGCGGHGNLLMCGCVHHAAACGARRGTGLSLSSTSRDNPVSAAAARCHHEAMTASMSRLPRSLVPLLAVSGRSCSSPGGSPRASGCPTCTTGSSPCPSRWSAPTSSVSGMPTPRGSSSWSPARSRPCCSGADRSGTGETRARARSSGRRGSGCGRSRSTSPSRRWRSLLPGRSAPFAEVATGGRGRLRAGDRLLDPVDAVARGVCVHRPHGAAPVRGGDARCRHGAVVGTRAPGVHRLSAALAGRRLDAVAGLDRVGTPAAGVAAARRRRRGGRAGGRARRWRSPTPAC